MQKLLKKQMLSVTGYTKNFEVAKIDQIFT